MSNKVRILFFADSHLGYDQPVSSRSKRVRRGPDFFRNFESILEYAQKQKVDLVIHGGDLFDRPNVHTRIVNRTYDLIFNFVDSGIPLFLVPGNHDRSTLPASLFLSHPNLHIYFEADVKSFIFNDIRFNMAGFPFVRNIGLDINDIQSRLLKSLPKEGINLLLMHQAVEGAVVGPSDYIFRAGRQVLRLDDLSDQFIAYLSGHIHPHQILWTRESKPKPFIYPGSIERTSFAERGETKGFLLLEFSQDKTLDISFRALPTRPMHIVDLGETEDALGEFLNDLVTKKYESNSVIRLLSPTKTLSEKISTAIKGKMPANVILEISHQWLGEVMRGRNKDS